jgi:hypothetical protein
MIIRNDYFEPPHGPPLYFFRDRPQAHTFVEDDGNYIRRLTYFGVHIS